jgi:hypothetical protein
MTVTFTGGPADAAALEAGRLRLDMSHHRLWLDYFALGGNHVIAQIEDWLTGATTVPAHDYDVLAHALNEAFTDRHFDRPIPYSNEM